MTYRRGNTAKELEMRGDWNKIGKKHYKNINGVEVKYDCNSYIWRVNGGVGWSTLWAAVEAVDHNTWQGWQ